MKLGFLRRGEKFEVSLSERAFDCVCDGDCGSGITGEVADK